MQSLGKSLARDPVLACIGSCRAGAARARLPPRVHEHNESARGVNSDRINCII